MPRKLISTEQVKQLLSEGRTHIEIAAILGCSKHTVNNHACKLNGTYKKADWKSYRYGHSYRLLEQDKCEICGCSPHGSRGGVLMVDHCHTSKKVRGMLCNRCNSALGVFNDSVALLLAAKKHLNSVVYTPSDLPKPESEEAAVEAIRPDDNTKIVKAYEEGSSLSAISRSTGLGIATIHDRLRKLGVNRRRRGSPAPTYSSDTERECKGCHRLMDISLFRTFGKSVSYYCKECYHNSYWIRYKYGLTAEVFKDILEKQNNKCPVSGRELTRGNIAVDHCHKTGAIRGVIDRRINMGLGLFKDSPELLDKAIAYLDKNKS